MNTPLLVRTLLVRGWRLVAAVCLAALTVWVLLEFFRNL